MKGKSQLIWSLKELTDSLKKRQHNKFDANIGVSGSRGDGKSTFLFKIFNSFKKEGFKQKKHQVYSQDDVKNLLANSSFGFCWDDEAINSGYKRDFQRVGQNELIKVVTNYRDNFNIYGSALPFFYNLDKALRELIFMHIHIIERGLAVILLPLDGQIHTQDPWDSVTNKKIEARENARLERNPKAKFRYHKFTTFAGFIYFGPMTTKQEKRYLAIKKLKRMQTFKKIELRDKEKTFISKMYDFLIEGKLTKQSMQDMCLMEGRKYSIVLSTLNSQLKDAGIEKTVTDFIRKSVTERNNSKPSPQISSVVPEI